MARAVAIRADPRDVHETLRLLLQPPRSLCASTGPLSTPPLQGACAACHCQGPVIQGQLPWEHTWQCLRLLQYRASLCRRRLALHSVPLPPPGLSEPEPPNQLLL